MLLLLPLAGAQSHEHDNANGIAMVLHDGPDDGRAVVGGFTHFGFALQDKEGRPVVHQDAEFTLEQNGIVLFQTTDTHEYDGLFSFDMTFTQPGAYRIVARSGDMAVGEFVGEAVLPANATQAEVKLELSPATALSNQVTGTLDIVGPDGATLPHTDALVEIRRASDLRLVTRFHAHIHEEPIAFELGLGNGGDFLAQVTAYNAFPTGRRPDFEAVLAQVPFTAGPAAAPSPPGAFELPPVLKPAGASATADGFTLHAMYDPQNQVGVDQPIRLSGLVTGNDTKPRAHVDFAFEVHGPRGLAFRSQSLHEYDGHWEWTYVPDAPGVYHANLVAQAGETELSVPFSFQVVPPAVVGVGGTGQGPATVRVDGLESIRAGVPVELVFSAASPGGAAQHSEFDVRIAKEGQPALHQFKLHTHASGESRALVVFPEAGAWIVHVDPLPTLPHAVTFQGPAGPGKPIAFTADVAPGAVDAAMDPLGADPRAEVPAPATLALLATVLGLALGRKDSRPPE